MVLYLTGRWRNTGYNWPKLKLTCRHIYRRHIFINIKSISFSPITLDKYHAWFHLYGLLQAVSNEKQAKNSKWKYMHPPEIKLATPRFQAWRLLSIDYADSQRHIVKTFTLLRNINHTFDASMK